MASEPLKSGVPQRKTLRNTDYLTEGPLSTIRAVLNPPVLVQEPVEDPKTHQRTQQNSNPIIITRISFVRSPLLVPGYIPDRPLGGPRTSLLEPGGGET